MKKKLFDYYHRYKIIFQIKLEFLGATFEFAKKSFHLRYPNYAKEWGRPILGLVYFTRGMIDQFYIVPD